MSETAWRCRDCEYAVPYYSSGTKVALPPFGVKHAKDGKDGSLHAGMWGCQGDPPDGWCDGMEFYRGIKPTE